MDWENEEHAHNCEACPGFKKSTEALASTRAHLWFLGMSFRLHGRYFKIEDVGDVIYGVHKENMDELLRQTLHYLENDPNNPQLAAAVKAVARFTQDNAKAFPEDSFIRQAFPTLGGAVKDVIIGVVDQWRVVKNRCKSRWRNAWDTGWTLPVSEVQPDKGMYQLVFRREKRFEHLRGEGLKPDLAMAEVLKNELHWIANRGTP